MIPRACEVIGHATPRPPIDINPRRSITMGGMPAEALSAEECARLWALVKGAAEGSNVGEAPDPHDHYSADEFDAA